LCPCCLQLKHAMMLVGWLVGCAQAGGLKELVEGALLRETVLMFLWWSECNAAK